VAVRALAVGSFDETAAPRETTLGADCLKSCLDRFPQVGEPAEAELGDAGLAGQQVQGDRGQRVARRPPGGDPVLLVMAGEKGQRLAIADVPVKHGGDRGEGDTVRLREILS